MDPSKKINSVDEYIASYPPDVQELLQTMRSLIRQAAPQATELMSYNMPAYKQHRVLVYFAANKNHIGFYPTSSITTIFKDELIAYKTSKGAIQFPKDKPIPRTLVKKIVKYRVAEDNEQATLKKKHKANK